ncbi:MAG: RNA 2',3'-cyclic phosphodiesterase [Deltaproteobacteria bacterium]|nr:RNA 2',3'-cyclic phosphodiesterase [Deltaproteobacteria bacterium]
MEIRSFLAFEQPAEIRDILTEVSTVLRKSRLDARWVKPENMHLTIHFLGNIPTESVHAMEEPIRKLCLTTAPFHISLRGMGCFPNSRNPRVLWIGLEGDLDRMGRLRDSLQDQMQAFGVKEEKRPFKPHLTLGRFRGASRAHRELEDILTQYRDLTGPVSTLRELILFKSDLKPGGAVYSKLKSWALTGSE